MAIKILVFSTLTERYFIVKSLLFREVGIIMKVCQKEFSPSLLYSQTLRLRHRERRKNERKLHTMASMYILL